MSLNSKISLGSGMSGSIGLLSDNSGDNDSNSNLSGGISLDDINSDLNSELSLMK